MIEQIRGCHYLVAAESGLRTGCIFRSSPGLYRRLANSPKTK